jgi:hypothetical protein
MKHTHITAAKRHALPKKEFGLPEQEKYPVDTKKRARAALAYASKEEHAGKLSEAQKEKIDRKAEHKLHEHEQDHWG